MQYDADEIRHITLLREMIEDAEALIGELEARKGYHMSRNEADALDDRIEDARFELARAERALLDDYGLTYEDGSPARPVLIRRTCADAVARLERAFA